MRRVSFAIAETAETTDVADVVPDLKQEEWPDSVSDLKPEEWPDAVPDLKQESAHAFRDLEEVADFEEESAHAFVDLEEWESADSVAVAFER